MRRLTAWVGGALGITAYRFLRRRPEVSTEEPDERADELRARLAESRAAAPGVDEFPAEGAAEDEAEPESPDERRRRVHEEGRATLDEMKPE